jgi:hypothetical protein
MKTIALYCLGLIGASAALAAPACVSGTLEDYVALGAEGCNFDGITFANFQYLTSTLNAVAPAPSDITVAPLAAWYELSVFYPPKEDFRYERVYASGFHFGLDAGLNRIENVSRMLDLDILYEAAFAAGLREVVQSAVLGADVLDTATATTYVDGRWCATTSGFEAVGRPGGCAFPAADVISVDEQIHTAVGPLPILGGAAVNSLDTGVVVTPEPVSGLLCATALLALAGILGKRRGGAA